MSPTRETAGAVVRRFVDRVRRRSCAEDAAAGAAALVCGTGAGWVGWVLAYGGAAAGGVVLVPAGCVAAALGARLLGRAIFRPPRAARAAAWIERAMPELRDSLATALEGGALAEASAEYAAPRVADARVGAVLPAPARRARAGVVTVAATVAVAALLVRAGARAVPAVPDATRRDAAGRGAAAAQDDAAGRTREPREAGGASAAALPARGGPRRMTLRAVAAPRDEALDAGPVDSAEILVSSPQGFERAVELFVAGDRPAHGSDPTP